MSAMIEKTATMSWWFDTAQGECGTQRAAVITIDGVRFSSPVPENAGEAETFNQTARAIMETLK